jgi:ATP-dependent DNA helicase RecG
MKSLKELINELNATDETVTIEAKRGSAIDRSVLETVCAYSNEPNIEGGYILLGIERVENSLFPMYEVTGVSDPDKLQLDLSTQCASMFSQSIRPKIEVEKTNTGTVLKVWIDELHAAQKPTYFKNEGLPRGAYRRIGSSDQRCTEDDLSIFYNHNETFDNSIVRDSTWDDIDENAISQYRKLRKAVNENAEELSYDDKDMLYALNCIHKDNGKVRLTVAGLHLFGSKLALRRLSPAIRVDYIRVPGNEWIQDPDDRFTTIDMRGSLLISLSRIYSAVVDDLPKGFLLPEGELQAQSVGLPGRVLREALVNALMHRSYKINQPIQIIRYGNRIEIKNPGYSLKSEDSLGEPGSQQRNPFIAAVFHETNLAETKGSGIRTMRNLMKRSGMVPPTFESNHSDNEFTARLLLHHFLSEDDLVWLNHFERYGINEEQKKALVFVREVGAIDNATYRQINGSDILKASSELRALKKEDLLDAKGRGRATYYVAGTNVTSAPVRPIDVAIGNSADGQAIGSDSAPPRDPKAPPRDPKAPPLKIGDEKLMEEVPGNIKDLINGLGKRSDKNKAKEIVVKLCKWRELQASEIATILGKSEKYVLREYISPLRTKGKIEYTIPDMVNHPKQAYKA